MNKKVLIFGTGFIASNLIKYFESVNIDSVVLYNKHKIQGLLDLKQYSMDKDIENLFKRDKFNYVIILQGNSFVSDNTNIEKSVDDNIFKITKFLETMQDKQLHKEVERIIVVGSASEYGKFYDEPIQENFILHPTSIYGLSKIFLFNISKYFIERGFPIVYVRQFNTVGIGQRDSFVLPAFIKSIALIESNKLKPILNVGDLSQERDFLDIRDTCFIYNLLLKKGVVGEVYNVASGKYISIKSLLDKIIKYSSLNSNNIHISSNPALFSKEVSLSKRLQADIQKIVSLGFKQRYTIEDTIKHTFSYWRKNV